MKTFIFNDSQFDGSDADAPDREILLEALENVYSELDKQEEVWTCKGRHNLVFWRGSDCSTIFCNAFVLLNPDDSADSRTEKYGYYFELEEAAA